MEIMVMKCPNCSGDINYAPGQRVTKCPYCDSVLNIKEGSDRAVLERTKNEFKNIEHIRYEYARSVQHWKMLTYLYYGLVFVLTITAFLLLDFFRNHSGGYDLGGIIFMMLCISFLAVPAVFSKTVPIPPKEVEQPLRLRSGLPAAVRMTVTALLVALGGGFIAYLIMEIL